MESLMQQDLPQDVAIKVSNLSKCYHIYEKPNDRLKQFVIPKLCALIPPLRKFIHSPLTTHHSPVFYKEFWALKDVSFEIKKGETVGIIGRNGSGKSTLLQIICGTLSPTAGNVQTNGRVAALLELGSGFNPEFSGRENVYMNATVLGLTQEQIDNCYDNIVAFADIGEFINQPVKTYSSGMYVRLAFAVAINVTPDILIVDEALGVGDIRFQAKCMRAIQEIKENGAAILFVTHSPGQIEALCKRAVWINDGLLKDDGLSKNLMRRYVNFMMHAIDDKEVAGSIDSSEMNQSTNNKIDTQQWIDISSKNNTKGSLLAVITRISVSQLNGEPLRILYTKSQKINVTFVVETRSDIDNPLLAVGIFNSLNEPIVHFNTENAQISLNRFSEETQYIFNFCFEMPALRPGEYLISIGIDDGISGASTVLCHVYDAWTFTMLPLQEKKTQGGYVQVEDINYTIQIKGQ